MDPNETAANIFIVSPKILNANIFIKYGWIMPLLNAFKTCTLRKDEIIRENGDMFNDSVNSSLH
jgi:hypothetical protein